MNQSAVLTLSGLPRHTRVSISFDLYVIMSWDGNNSLDGPDLVEVGVGRKQARATFSNDAQPHDDNYLQTYPGRYPAAKLQPGLTGADDVSTLGYPDVSLYGGVGDATYHIQGTFPHRQGTLRLRISSTNTVDPGVDPIEFDESFGVDNVAIRLLRTPCHH